MIDVIKIAKTLAYNIRKFVKLFDHLNRESIANIYIRGNGIEIGALHNPLNVPKSAAVKYVDRISIPDLRKQYPELKSREFVNVDIIDDGERLETIQDSTQDFVIVNHFIEHCQNPIEAIINTLRVLKSGGILYLTIPDKRYTFDSDRPATSVEHLIRDYREGPDWSKKQHFKEWIRIVNKVKDETEGEKQINHLMNINYSIHYHAWTQSEMLEFILTLKKELNLKFEVELFFKDETEVIFVLKKSN